MNFNSSHGGFEGKSLIEKIRDKLDKARDTWKEFEAEDDEQDASRNRSHGRCEGLAAALGILRGTSTKHEMEECESRCTG